MAKKPLEIWYKDGLRFKCTKCGKCCTGDPGYVWLTDADIECLSDHLKLSTKDFLYKYTRFVANRYSLKEDSISYDCVFFKDNKCLVYDKRPSQCKKFPWWPENLTSEESWKQLEGYCEGVNHKDAPLISSVEIEKNLKG